MAKQTSRAKTALRTVGRLVLALIILVPILFFCWIQYFWYRASILKPEEQARISKLQGVIAEHCKVGSSIDTCLAKLGQVAYAPKRSDLPSCWFDKTIDGVGHTAFIQIEAKGDKVSVATVETATVGLP